MFRSFLTLTLVFAAPALARAHFPFVIPEADGSKAIVVFSDSLEPDKTVNVDKIAGTKLQVRDASGNDIPLEMTKGEARFLANIPGTGSRVIHGSTDYGVLQKGEGKPFRLVYHPKAILGGRASAALGEKTALEVVPVGPAGKTQFQVLSANKPVADAEVTVLLPGGGKKAVKTGADGLTPPFEPQGRYGVVAKWFEAKSGEQAGLKYEQVRHYATLVFDSSAK